MRQTTIIFTVLGGLFFSIPLLPGESRRCEAHEIPDNFVERSLSIVVRDDTVLLTYRAGLNIDTMRVAMQRWGCPAAEYANSLSDQDLNENFRRVAFDKISAGLKVSLNGKPVRLRKVSCEPSPRHHFSLVARYELALGKPKKPVELELVDENFTAYEGAVRYSLKAMGSAMVLRSNVAPIIVRAERYELADLPPEKRIEVCRVRAKLGFTAALPQTEERNSDG
ncbi:MAG: hypothetical protein VYE64_06820 [Planctomycetota bacterium]|nr:hypothetical protein [Planctomycetota bacterium]